MPERVTMMNRSRQSAEVIVPSAKYQERRSMDWRLFATKPKGGYIWKPAVLNLLPD